MHLLKNSHGKTNHLIRSKSLVECKSHRWTAGDNIPSAKITVWNEAMYYFHLAPQRFRKVFVLRDFSEKRGETLATYYARNYGHLIPSDVEILEYDEESQEVLSVLTHNDLRQVKLRPKE